MPAHSYPSPSPTGLEHGMKHQSQGLSVPIENIRQRLAGTNINEQTLLATDYLNHFNEIEMLIEMVPSMPECFEDICQWQPKSYEEHFSASGFRDKDLAILAYQHAPDLVRKHFDATIATLERCIIDAIEFLKETYEMGGSEDLSMMSTRLTVELRHHIDRASAIINGHSDTYNVDDFNATLPAQRDSIEKTQAAVEELFNDSI